MPEVAQTAASVDLSGILADRTWNCCAETENWSIRGRRNQDEIRLKRDAGEGQLKAAFMPPLM